MVKMFLTNYGMEVCSKNNSGQDFQQTQHNELLFESLNSRVLRIIDTIPNHHSGLSEIINLLGKEGMLLFSALLTIIFLIPVSIPGFSTIFGAIIFFIAFSQMIDKELWLPQIVKRKQIPTDKLRISLHKGLKWFRLIEKISKPYRLNLLISNKIANRINNFSILLGALLLMLPLGFIPFGNTFPAIAILFLSIGILQKDGIIIVLGHVSNLGSLVYFTLFFSTISVAIKHVFHEIGV
jgi:hypothetical protein